MFSLWVSVNWWQQSTEEQKSYQIKLIAKTIIKSNCFTIISIGNLNTKTVYVLCSNVLCVFMFK